MTSKRPRIPAIRKAVRRMEFHIFRCSVRDMSESLTSQADSRYPPKERTDKGKRR
jgi:hypothetical protein